MERSPAGFGLCAAILVVLFGAALGAQDRNPPGRRPQQNPPPPVVESGRRAGEIVIETSVAVPAGAQALEIWIPAPRVDESQTVLEAATKSPIPGAVTQDTDPETGNTFLYLKVPFPRGTITLGAAWKFERRELARLPRRTPPADAQDGDAAALARHLGPSELVPVTGRMKVRAGMIAPAETDPLAIARAIYDEVLKTVEYSTKGQGWGRGDALWALDAGYGDSADFAALFVGLARARGIPARFAMGFLLPERRSGPEAEIAGYEAWAEFFVAGTGWIPVDLAGARRNPEFRQYGFGNLSERHLQFTTGRDVRLAPRSKRATHNYLVYPYAEIDGEPAPLTNRFSFKEK